MAFCLENVSISDRKVLSDLIILANLDNPYGQLAYAGTPVEDRLCGSYARIPSKMLAKGTWMMKLRQGDKVIAYTEWSLPEKLWDRMRFEHAMDATPAEREQFDNEYRESVDDDDWPVGMRMEVPTAVSPAMREVRKVFPTDREYMFLDQLKTLPEHRRRGAGSELLQWGLELADREGLELCLEAMPLGMGLYLRNGFKKLHEVSLDLAKFGGTSVFTWVFMIRRPRQSNRSADTSS